MKRHCANSVDLFFSSLALSMIFAGAIGVSRPALGSEESLPACNVGDDPAIKGCFGTCDSPKVCRPGPITKVCECR
jgi:hypothetical protein